MKINQLKSGVVLSYMAIGISILTSLVYTPIMLRLLGQSEYGVYQLVASVVSYLSIFSFGFGASYMRFYSQRKEKNDLNGIAQLNGMFFIIFSVISLFTLVLGFILVLNARSVFGSKLTENELHTAKILLLLMVINLAMTFFASTFNAQLIAHEKFFVFKLLLVLNKILNPLITLPLLLLGYGSIAMVCVTTALTALDLVINIYFSLKIIRSRFSFKHFDFSLFKEMFVFTFFIFLNSIVDQINWNTDKFLLGRMAGTTAVAVYGVASQLNSMYNQFSGNISSVFVPRVNKLVASESDKTSDINTLFIKVGRIQFIVLILILSGVAFFGKPFIIFWAGEKYADAYQIALLLMTPVTVPFIQNLGIEIQRAKNMHKARSVVYLAVAISNIFISIPCIKQWGAKGAAIGTALTMIMGCGFFMNWYYHKKIGLNIIEFWKQILKFVPSLIAPFACGFLLMKFFEIDSVIKLIAAALIYTAVFCASMWLLGLNSYEKNLVKKPIKKILNAVKR